MGFALIGLGGILGIVAFVCWIMVVVKMFQNDQSTMGIVSIITMFCSGIGHLVALIVGWMNAAAWQIKNLMIAYTVCLVLAIVLLVPGYILVIVQAVQNAEPIEMDGINISTDF